MLAIHSRRFKFGLLLVSTYKTMVERTWQCKCGEVKFKLKGEPRIAFNCHCHSCVACIRHVDAKGLPNTSALSDSGGAAKALWYLDNVDVTASYLEGKLNFIKVGDSGAVVRSYTKCCGTIVNTAGGATFGPGFRPFNRNCITNSDGSAFSLPDVVNVQAANAFNPEQVPPPKANGYDCQIITAFAGGIFLMKTGISTGAASLLGAEAFFKDPNSVTEVVPITW